MYWHNGRSLGHTAEVAKISKAIEKDMPSNFMAGLTGAYTGLDMLSKKMDLVKLPGFSNYDRLSGWNYTGRQGMQPDELFACRAEIATSFIKHYKPDIFLVNHVPKGLYDELATALLLPRNGMRILTLRGILFDKEKTDREYFKGEALRWLLNTYDAIFVHIDPNVFSLEENYHIPLEVSQRIQYTGYLTEESSFSKKVARKQIGIDEEQKIVVCSMGGGQGAFDIWKNIIEALKNNINLFDMAYLILGPYLEPEDAKKIIELQNTYAWLQVKTYVADMPVWMTASDLMIGAAGSNMLGEILACKCNSIVIPRQVREVEQHIHSTILSNMKLVRMCALQDVLNGSLNKMVATALTEPLSISKSPLMNGSSKYCTYLSDWYNRTVKE